MSSCTQHCDQGRGGWGCPRHIPHGCRERKAAAPTQHVKGQPLGGGPGRRRRKVSGKWASRAGVLTPSAFLLGVGLYLLAEDKMRYNQLASNGSCTQAPSMALLEYYLP